MAGKRKSYSQEFKIEALKEWQESGKSASEVEQELGLSRGMLYKWQSQLGDATSQSASGTEAMPIASELAEAEAGADAENMEPGSLGDEPAPVADETEPGVVASEPALDEAAAIQEETEPETEQTLTAEVESRPDEQAAESKPGKGKTVFKRIAGVIGLVLGAIGVLLTVAVIVALWFINTPATESAVRFLQAIEAALEMADAGLDQADGNLEAVRERLGAAAEAFPAEELLQYINDAQSIVDAAQTTANTASSVAGFASAIPFAGPGGGGGSGSTPTLDQASATLEEISARLDAIESDIIQRQESGEGGALLAQAEAEVAQLQEMIQNVDRSVEEANSAVIQLQQELPGWIDTMSIVLTILLLWLGLAQFSLLAHGWEWLRG